MGIQLKAQNLDDAANVVKAVGCRMRIFNSLIFSHSSLRSLLVRTTSQKMFVFLIGLCYDKVLTSEGMYRKKKVPLSLALSSTAH